MSTKTWTVETRHVVRESRFADYERIVAIGRRVGMENLDVHGLREAVALPNYTLLVTLDRGALQGVYKGSAVIQPLRGALLFEKTKKELRIGNLLIEFDAEDYFESLSSLVDNVIMLTTMERPIVKVFLRREAETIAGYFSRLGFRPVVNDKTSTDGDWWQWRLRHTRR